MDILLLSRSVVLSTLCIIATLTATLLAGCGGDPPATGLDATAGDLGGDVDGSSMSDAGADGGPEADAGDRDAEAESDAGAPFDDAGLDAGTLDDAGGDDAGPVGCTAAMCDDGLDCTLDACDGLACTHQADSLACAPGTYCDPGMGCARPVPCATAADCVITVADPCIVAPTCDARTRTCVYGRLDGDGDGFAPPACGGTDCNDADPTAHPMGIETCDGVDDDCNGVIDAPLAADACAAGLSCAAGACSCAGTMCADYPWGAPVCVDLQTSATHCGSCTTNCGTDSTCVAGACTCEPSKTRCYGGCADLQTSPSNCGMCGRSCPTGALCIAGDCECPAGESYCASRGCVNLATDTANCGVCDRACTARATCGAGVCTPDVPWFTWWQGYYSGYGADLFDVRIGGMDVVAASADRVYVMSGPPKSGSVSHENTSSPGYFGGVSAVDVVARSTPWRAYGQPSGTGAAAYVVGMAPTSSGGVTVVLGHIATASRYADFRSTGASVRLPSTTFDFTVFGLDASGAIVSQSLYGGTGADYVTASASRGTNLWLVGTASAPFMLGTTSVAAGPWLARFSDGVLAAATSLPAQPTSLSVAPNGSVVVGGAFSGSVTFGARTLVTRTPSDSDVFVARYGTDAAVVSAYKLGLLGTDAVGAIGAANDRALVDVTELGVSLVRDDGTVVWSRGGVDAAGLAPVFSSLLILAGGELYAAGQLPPSFSAGGLSAAAYSALAFTSRLDASSGSAVNPLYWAHGCAGPYCGLTRLAPIDANSVVFASSHGRGAFAASALTYGSNTGGMLVGRTR